MKIKYTSGGTIEGFLNGMAMFCMAIPIFLPLLLLSMLIFEEKE